MDGPCCTSSSSPSARRTSPRWRCCRPTGCAATRRFGPGRACSPKRIDEVSDGGSIYWVVAGFVRVRQRILGLREEQWDDKTPCAALLLDPTLVAVEARPMKAFQGWRYLKPEEAPADVDMARPATRGLDRLPPQLRRELAELCLI